MADYEAYMMFEVVGFVRNAADAETALCLAQEEYEAVTHVKEIPGAAGSRAIKRRRFEIEAE